MGYQEGNASRSMKSGQAGLLLVDQVLAFVGAGITAAR
jgi:hypothetical protein